MVWSKPCVLGTTKSIHSWKSKEWFVVNQSIIICGWFDGHGWSYLKTIVLGRTIQKQFEMLAKLGIMKLYIGI
jgi:hypothetical protein